MMATVTATVKRPLESYFDLLQDLLSRAVVLSYFSLYRYEKVVRVCLD
jgi:hypothetical protein